MIANNIGKLCLSATDCTSGNCQAKTCTGIFFKIKISFGRTILDYFSFLANNVGGSCLVSTDCTNGNCLNRMCTGIERRFKFKVKFFLRSKTHVYFLFNSKANNVGGNCLVASDCTNANCQGGTCACKSLLFLIRKN